DAQRILWLLESNLRRWRNLGTASEQTSGSKAAWRDKADNPKSPKLTSSAAVTNARLLLVKAANTAIPLASSFRLSIVAGKSLEFKNTRETTQHNANNPMTRTPKDCRRSAPAPLSRTCLSNRASTPVRLST